MEFTPLPTSSSTQPRFEKRTRAPRVLAIGALILVGVLAGSIILWRSYKTQTHVQQVLTQQLESCDGSVCTDAVRLQFARTQETTKQCDAMQDDAMKSVCYQTVASLSGDASLCDKVTQDDQAFCVDSAVIVRAKEKQSIDLCNTIKDEGLRSSCGFAITKTWALRGSCPDTLGDTWKPICQQEKDINDIVKARDFNRCQSLALDDARSQCTDQLNGIDDDGDGLSFVQEQAFGTSDQKKDTDGDGFDDSIEVTSGHNPLGQ